MGNGRPLSPALASKIGGFQRWMGFPASSLEQYVVGGPRFLVEVGRGILPAEMARRGASLWRRRRPCGACSTQQTELRGMCLLLAVISARTRPRSPIPWPRQFSRLRSRPAHCKALGASDKVPSAALLPQRVLEKAGIGLPQKSPSRGRDSRLSEPPTRSTVGGLQCPPPSAALLQGPGQVNSSHGCGVLPYPWLMIPASVRSPIRPWCRAHS